MHEIVEVDRRDLTIARSRRTIRQEGDITRPSSSAGHRVSPATAVPAAATTTALVIAISADVLCASGREGVGHGSACSLCSTTCIPAADTRKSSTGPAVALPSTAGTATCCGNLSSVRESNRCPSTPGTGTVGIPVTRPARTAATASAVRQSSRVAAVGTRTGPEGQQFTATALTDDHRQHVTRRHCTATACVSATTAVAIRSGQRNSPASSPNEMERHARHSRGNRPCLISAGVVEGLVLRCTSGHVHDHRTPVTAASH